MTLNSIKESSWYKERPIYIRKVIDKVPPIFFYKMKTGYQCQIVSYDEDFENPPNVTLTVYKTGVGGPDQITGGIPNPYAAGQVFGVDPDSLTHWR